MDRPVSKLPEFNLPSTRPVSPTRPVTRPGATTLPIKIDRGRFDNNYTINKRPSWVNINHDRVGVINNRWQSQINGLQGWNTRHPDRAGYWHGWANGCRYGSQWHHHYHGCFNPNWWGVHYHPWCGWHYGWQFGNYNWNYWWTVPTYAALNRWFTWTAPQQVWAQPVYYDYGTNGNVSYYDNRVYINGEDVGTASEFAQSAADLATVAPPPDDETAKAAEWMPLGTFAVSRSEKDTQPNMVVQLAVNKEGVISGTLYDTASDKSQTVQGRVDNQTQRVAVRIGENENLVVETGIYNLTQDEAPLLVHFGEDKVENWLLVRLDAPADANN